MCGIAGIYNLNKEPVQKADIVKLTDAIRHRGPDGRGIWIENKIAFGHRRLAILDLSAKGKQPMSFDNGRFWITLNGEIYNFIEIRDELIKKGYRFVSESDTEVILAAYKEWGERMLDRFNGMWAFAIYDTKEKKLFLSRDRFGVKPLYYYLDKNRLIFASEVQAIHKIVGNSHALNEEVIKDIAYGSFLNHGTNQTYLKDVFTLPGGFCLSIKKGKTQIKEWYKLKKIKAPESFSEQTKQLKGLIFDACKIRLRSDVPIGTCLSGGIDSGSITAVIDTFKPKPGERFSKYSHRAFCAAFPGTPIDESEKAKLLAKKLETKLDIVNIEAPSIEELKTAMEECDGPMHALAFFPIWKLYSYIKKQGITVTLDGQGPDEMLGGYRPVMEGLRAAIELKKPFWFVDVFNTYSAQGETSQFSSKLFAMEVLAVLLFERPILVVASVLSLLGFTKMNDDLRKYLFKNKQKFKFSKKTPNFTNSLDKNLFEQFFQSPLPGILNQYDRCSMAHGIECRMPFMDYRIVEFIFSIPPDSKVGHGYTKRILREAVKDILPDQIRLDKNKIGFNAPIVDWFRGPLKKFMIDEMEKSDFINSKYFDGKKIKDDYQRFISEKNPKWEEAWKFWPPVHLTWWMNYKGINQL